MKICRHQFINYQIFRSHPMKKINLKAKKLLEPSSSKQMKLDSFFVKKLSPNKENVGDDIHETSVNRTSFLCLSDVHDEVPLKNSSLTDTSKPMNKNEKVLRTNGESSNSSSSSVSKKRKSSCSLGSGTNTDEFLTHNNSKEASKSVFPPSKKVNLNDSTEITVSPVNNKKDLKETDQLKSMHHNKHDLKSSLSKTVGPSSGPKKIVDSSICNVSVVEKTKAATEESTINVGPNKKCFKDLVKSSKSTSISPKLNFKSAINENANKTVSPPSKKANLSDSTETNISPINKKKDLKETNQLKSKHHNKDLKSQLSKTVSPPSQPKEIVVGSICNISVLEKTKAAIEESTVNVRPDKKCFKDLVKSSKSTSISPKLNFKPIINENASSLHSALSDTKKNSLQKSSKSQKFVSMDNENDIVFKEKKLSPPRKQLFCDKNLSSSSDVPFKRSLEEVDLKTVAITAEIKEPTVVLNQSDGSVIDSSQLESTVRNVNTLNNEACDQNAMLSDTLDNDFFFEDWDFSSQQIHRDLTLDTMKRCRIMNVEIVGHHKSITLQSFEDENAQTVCKLQGAWFHTVLEINDIVNIVAELKEKEWVIDNTGGLLILSPDTLISSTSLMGSMFCRRRAVLSNSFQISEPGAKCMVTGILVHMLLQKVMKNNIRCKEKIHQVIRDIIFDSSLVHMLLSSQMSFEEVEKELCSFTPEILKFMESYVAPISRRCSGDSWSGEIISIKDIEENIWSPTYGMKGKIDVTVEVNVKGTKKIMPFELKTGKSSNSAEHRGQVILYVMMMVQLNYDVSSGLLFYLKDGEMKEVPIDYRVQRDIMMLRNDFVHFISLSQIVKFLDDGSIGGPILPEPIHHHSACGKCPYQTFCCAALVDDNMTDVDPNNLLTKLSATNLLHLKSLHIRYVFHWIGLLKIEEAERRSRRSSDEKDLWCSSAEKREKSGTCIANLSLVKVDCKDDSFVHLFQFKNRNGSNNFTAGDFVILSTDTRTAVSMGSILCITEDTVTINFEKDLGTRGEKIFHLDRYDSQKFFNFDVSNLSSLLENSPHAQKLREAIIERKPPLFNKYRCKLPENIETKLNVKQKKAVLRAITAESYMLIQGMPGCGKTETLAALVRVFVENGQRVLITSHTHSAVDNLVLRLCGIVDVLRLGSKNKIHPSLHEFSDEALLSKSQFKSLEDIRHFYLSKKVVAVTVLGCSHPVLSLQKFDVCIVDEATQVLQPSILRPLMAADKFILVGDPVQLPPLVISSVASASGLSESLFVRLNRPLVTVVLNTQYRMNKQITSLANLFMYNGALKCANETVANNALRFSLDTLSSKTMECFSWLKLALSCKIEHSVVFVDVKELSVIPNNESCVNHSEAKMLMVVLEALINGGVKHESIGVIAPYRAQVNLIRQQTLEKNFNIEVNTVDQYQGRDKEIILFSCTARSAAKDAGILSSNQRLSVAITRAKQKLLFFGNSTVLKTYKTFEEILGYIGVDCFVNT